MLKLLKLSTTIFLLLLFLSNCSHSSWQTKAVASYELIGVLPSETCKQLETLCKNSTFPQPEKCDSLKTTCNKARHIYITTGNVLTLVINTTDSIQKERLQQDYYKLLSEFTSLTYEIIDLGVKYGVIDLSGVKK